MKLADVCQAPRGTDEVRAACENERRFVAAEVDVATHAAGEIDDHLLILFADALEDLAEQSGVAAGCARGRVAYVNVHDRRPGSVSLERRGCDLRGRDRDVRAFLHRVAGAGDGAGDEDGIADHGALSARGARPRSITPTRGRLVHGPRDDDGPAVKSEES